MERESMDYDVYIGMDVGKSSSYVVCLDQFSDRKIFSLSVDQEERSIRESFTKALEFGKPLLIVDVYGGFGMLPVSVAHDMGVDVAHLPSRAFRQMAQTYGEDKTDAKDAFIIADVARTQPRLIGLVNRRQEVLEEIRILSSSRQDCVRERTRVYSRTHELLQRVCPPLEKLFAGWKLHSDLAIRLFARYGGPQGFRKAGVNRVSKWAGSLKYHSGAGPRKVEEIFKIISTQETTVPAAGIIEAEIRKLASRILELEAEEDAYNERIAQKSATIREVQLLKSIPGIGDTYAAIIASEIGDIIRFPSAGNLASYGGVAPVRYESGTSIKKSRKRKGGNRKLKNAFMQSAQIALNHDVHAKEYYERKRAEGKSHKQAVRALARRRVEVIYAILVNGTFYEPLPIAA